MPAELSDLITLFNVDHYSSESSVQDNILFGKLVFDKAKAEERIGGLIRSVIEEVGIYRDVMRLGLSHNVGIGGANIASDQRQKIALMRAVIKVTDILVINDALSVLDKDAQRRIIANIQSLRRDRGLYWVLAQESLTDSFNQVVTIDKGKLVKSNAGSEPDSE